MSSPTTSIEDGTAPPTSSNEKSVEWLVKPLVDKQAPLILRANCIRSLALLTASSRDQRIRLQKGKGVTNPSNLSQTILDVQSSVDNAVKPFLSDATSLGARVSSVTHLHSFNLLALLLGETGSSGSSGSAKKLKRVPPAAASPASGSPSLRRRKRMDQSHIPEWRHVVVSPPSRRGKFDGSGSGNGNRSPGSPGSSPGSPSRASPRSPGSLGSPEFGQRRSSPTRTDKFAENFFDEMMMRETRDEASSDSKQGREEKLVLSAFENYDVTSKSCGLQQNASSSLLKQLTGPTHGVSPPRRSAESRLPNISEEETSLHQNHDDQRCDDQYYDDGSAGGGMKMAWATPERERKTSIAERFPKGAKGAKGAAVSSPSLGRPYQQVLPPPPPSPRRNAMRPMTPTRMEAPFAKITSSKLNRDHDLLESRAHQIVRDIDSDEEESRGDETGDAEWEAEELMRQTMRHQQKKLKPPMVRGLRGFHREEEMMEMLTLVAPKGRMPNPRNGGVLDTSLVDMPLVGMPLDMMRLRTGSLVLLPPGAAREGQREHERSLSPKSLSSSFTPPPPPPPPPPAPSSSSNNVFLWLPSELQQTTENLMVRTELAREATRRAQIGLAQRMAREVLKLPFDFMAIHGTSEMLTRVGALAFRVAVQRLGQRRLRETWEKLFAWLSRCRAADAKRLRLLSRMSYLIELYHDKVSKRGLKKWYRWMRKLRWIANRQRWGSTKLQKILTKAQRRNQRRRMYNAYMKMKGAVEKWHADQLRRRMAASKVRKMLWQRMVEGMKRVFFNLKRMGVEPYIVKLQWAWRKRLFRRNEHARVMQVSVFAVSIVLFWISVGSGWRVYNASCTAAPRHVIE